MVGCIKYIKATDAGVAQFHLGGNSSSSLSSRRTDATGRSTYDATILRAGAMYLIQCYRATVLPYYGATYDATIYYQC